MHLPIGYHHLRHSRGGLLFQFGKHNSFFFFPFTHPSAMSNSTTSSIQLRNGRLSQKTFHAWWVICELSYWLKSGAKPRRDLPLNLNIFGRVCLILLPLYEWGLRILITSLPLLLFPHSLSLSLSLYPNNHTLSLLVSVFYVAACASDLNTRQGVVGRASRCEGSLWLRESWRSNTVMIRTTGWQWRGGI